MAEDAGPSEARNARPVSAPARRSLRTSARRTPPARLRSLAEYSRQGWLYVRSVDRPRDRWRMLVYLVSLVWLRVTGWTPFPSVEVTLHATRYDLRPSASDHLALHEVVLDQAYLPSEAWLPPAGGWVIDAGANIGAYALECAAAVGPEGRVDAVEPEPSNFAALLRNIERNPQGRVVVAHRLGLWGGGGRAALSNRGGTGVCWQVRPDEHGSVWLRTLDDLVRSCSRERIDLIKIDTEGAEEEVLRGGQHALARTDRVILEYHAPGLRASVEALMAQAAFERVYERELGDGLGIVGYARRGSIAGGRLDRLGGAGRADGRS